MTTVLRWFCVLVCFAATLVSDPEHIREVQEELRKRNLFFGDVDGTVTPQLTSALKKYQARKGFEPTGTVDANTAASLQVQSSPQPGVEGSAPVAAAAPSDTPGGIKMAATEIDTINAPQTVRAGQSLSATQAANSSEAAAELVAHARGEAAWADLPVTPEPPAEAPTPPDLITADRVNRFVETYLADGETDDIGLQVWFYAFPVRYFNHGLVNQDFVVKDTKSYVKRWPERKYTIVGPVTFDTSGPPGETQIQFTIDYTVRNKSQSKSGRTRNFWTVRTTGDEMKIIAIREERVRG
jgi:peptidoglycan hydrolase-like protein with peptidoglycan-binding domain